jgi:probable phosphoglycerate mutase
MFIELMVSMMEIVYLVRHATPDWSRKDIPYHIPPGPPLTETGRREAADLGAFLRYSGVRRIYASPLERSEDTARIAGQTAGADVVVDPALQEIYPNETPEQILRRVQPAFERAAAESAEIGPAALVTHGGPVTHLLAKLGLDADTLEQLKRTYDRRNPLPPAGVWRASRSSPDAPWELQLVFTPVRAM